MLAGQPYEVSTILRLQRAIGNQAVQRMLRAGSESSGGDFKPGARQFPHAASIRRSLGVSLPLAAVSDPAGCAARGVPAFTDGQITHFASPTPGLHVAAHEAAHQLQHAGLTNDGGLGPEGHAGAVADQVSSGLAADRLLGPHGRPVPSAIRNYVLTDKAGNWQGVEGGAVLGKLSETGETLTFSSQVAYATPALIARANAILQAKQSGITIAPGSGNITVQAPNDKSSKTLASVDVKLPTDPQSAKFYADCRQAARSAMGPSSANLPESALCSPGKSSSTVAGAPDDLVAKVLYLDQRMRATPGYDAMTPEQKREVAAQAQADFDNLSPEEKDKLKRSPVAEQKAKELGIDQYAAPGVGEAFAVFRADKPAINEFRFHYATVIMATTADQVTLENSGGAKDELSKNWKIETYGPASKQQTFHDEYTTFGRDRHTLRLGTLPPAPAGVGDLPSLPTRELIRRLRDSKDGAEQSYLRLELGRRKLLAWVDVIKKKSWVGNDSVSVVAGGQQGRSTGSVSIPEGQSNVFSLPILSLWPLPDPLVVEVHNFGFLGNELIGSVAWPAPYTAQYMATLTSGSAKYTLQVSM